MPCPTALFLKLAVKSKCSTWHLPFLLRTISQATSGPRWLQCQSCSYGRSGRIAVPSKE